MPTFLEKNKVFIKNLLILAVPIILQNLIGASVNLLDNIMIGSLGENEIAATGIANQYYMVFFNTANGFIMGAGIFMSQYWGKRDIKSIHKFIGIALVFSTGMAILFAIGAVVFSDNIMHLFTKDSVVTSLGRDYLVTVTLSYIFTTISLSFGMALRSVGFTKIPMYGSLIGLVFNGILNYIFIFGKLGISPLGVTGAALGTTVARFMEMSFILVTIYIVQKNMVAGKIREIMSFNLSLIKRFLITATPVVFNDIMWTVGFTTYFVIYSRLGTNATATMQICSTVNNAFNIFGIGIAVAASILIGNQIGADEIDKVKESAMKISIFGIVLGIIIGIFFFIIAPYVTLIFKITEETKRHVIQVLRVMSVVLPLRFYGIVQIIGVLRGGGDVMYAIGTELIAVWCIGVPLSYLGVEYFNVSITIVYALTCLEEVFKVIATTPRLLSGKWIKSLVKE